MNPLNYIASVPHRASTQRDSDEALPTRINMTLNQLEKVPAISRWLIGSLSERHNRRVLLRRMIEYDSVYENGYLNLSGLNVTSLPDNFGKLVDIKHLDLKNNRLRRLPKSIGKLKNLKRLEVQDNNLKKLPKSIGQLENLEVIDARGNHELRGSPGMVEGVIRYNTDRWEDTPHANQASSSHSTTGTISSYGVEVGTRVNRLRNIPDVKRWLDNSAHSELPNRMELLRRIAGCESYRNRFLDLSNLNITSLPENFGQLVYADYLNLDNNALQTLPISIERSNVKCLTINNNRLQCMPRIWQFNKLERLELNNNDIEELPEYFFWAFDHKLRHLEINGNRKLRRLPESIRYLAKLEHLQLKDNDLEELPEILGSLANLTYLDIGGNEKLRCLPESIGQLSKLEILNICGINSLSGLERLVERVRVISSENAATSSTRPPAISARSSPFLSPHGRLLEETVSWDSAYGASMSEASILDELEMTESSQSISGRSLKRMVSCESLDESTWSVSSILYESETTESSQSSSELQEETIGGDSPGELNSSTGPAASIGAWQEEWEECTSDQLEVAEDSPSPAQSSVENQSLAEEICGNDLPQRSSPAPAPARPSSPPVASIFEELVVAENGPSPTRSPAQSPGNNRPLAGAIRWDDSPRRSSSASSVASILEDLVAAENGPSPTQSPGNHRPLTDAIRWDDSPGRSSSASASSVASILEDLVAAGNGRSTDRSPVLDAPFSQRVDWNDDSSHQSLSSASSPSTTPRSTTSRSNGLEWEDLWTSVWTVPANQRQGFPGLSGSRNSSSSSVQAIGGAANSRLLESRASLRQGLADAVRKWLSSETGSLAASLFEGWEDFQSEPGAQHFSTLLERFRGTAEIHSPFFLMRLSRMFAEIKENQSLRAICFNASKEALGKSGNRDNFQNIEFLIKAHKTGIDGSTESLVRFGKECFRMGQVEQIARETALSRKKTNQPNQNDESIEVYLAYETGLKAKGVCLPVQTEMAIDGHLFVSEQDIDRAALKLAAKENSPEMIDFLLNFELLQNHLKKAFADEFKKFEQSLEELQNALAIKPEVLADDEYLKLTNIYAEARNEGEKQLRRDLTERVTLPRVSPVDSGSYQSTKKSPMPPTIAVTTNNQPTIKLAIMERGRKNWLGSFKSFLFGRGRHAIRNAGFNWGAPTGLKRSGKLVKAVRAWIPDESSSSKVSMFKGWENFQSEPGAEDFANLLNRLDQTMDGRLPFFRHRVAKMLAEIKNDHNLRAICFKASAEALEGCGDRVAHSFQDLELLAKAHRIGAHASTEGLVRFGKECFRMSKVEEIARRDVLSRWIPGEHDDESVEVYLAYETGLKARGFSLPTETGNTLHAEYFVQEMELDRAAQELAAQENGPEMMDFLLHFELLQNHLKTTFASEFKRFEQSLEKLQEALAIGPEGLTDGGYLRLVSAYAEVKKAGEERLRRELTEKVALQQSGKPGCPSLEKLLVPDAVFGTGEVEAMLEELEVLRQQPQGEFIYAMQLQSIAEHPGINLFLANNHDHPLTKLLR